MKIAVTADNHLTAGNEHPKRLNALKNIIEQMNPDDRGQEESEPIENLIIAGDLFDKSLQNYSVFEEVSNENQDVQFHIIPGNHDPGICIRDIPGDNIHIYTEPEIVPFDSVPFLFVPYDAMSSMGEKIAIKENEISGAPWVLVGHGDYITGVKERSPREPGIYMPLVRHDVERFRPRTVLLGHIHKAADMDEVHYVGSPCGLDINETGKRRFLVFDTTNMNTKSHVVDTDIIYVSETFIIIPHANEITELKKEIDRRIDAWDIVSDEYHKVRVRVKAMGYTSDKEAVEKTLTEKFKRFGFYNNEKPDTCELSINDDPQLKDIATETRKLIEGMTYKFGGDEPIVDEVIYAALEVIYKKQGGQ